MTSDPAGSPRGLNYYLTFAGRDDETPTDVLFFGLQDGNWLFVRSDTLEQEAVEDRRPSHQRPLAWLTDGSPGAMSPMRC